MARTLSAGSNLSHAAAVRSAAPLTMACWFKLSTLASAQTLMAIDSNSNQNRFALDLTITAGALRALITAAGASSAASTTANASTGAWSHGCAVFTSATDRSVFLNGANKGTNNTSRTPASLSRTWLGLLAGPTNVLASGDIAECAIWSVALSDAEVAVLASGIAPYEVQRANLLAYWPIIGHASPDPDVAGAFPMTLAGSPPQVAHPFMFYGKNRFKRRGLAA